MGLEILEEQMVWLVTQLGDYGNEGKGKAPETRCEGSVLVVYICVSVLVMASTCQKIVPLPVRG